MKDIFNIFSIVMLARLHTATFKAKSQQLKVSVLNNFLKK